MIQHLHILSVGAAGLWLLAGALRGYLPFDQRTRAMWVLIFAGVPLLGGLTMSWGPTAGVAGFAVGLAVLIWPPRRATGRRGGTRAGFGLPNDGQ